MGMPPDFWISSNKTFVHLTSPIIFAFGLESKIDFASIKRIISELMKFPSLSTTPSLSPSPSNAIPISSFFSKTKSFKKDKLLSIEGSGWWFGKFPSGSSNKICDSHPNFVKTFFTNKPIGVFAQSIPIRIFFDIEIFLFRSSI